MITRRELIRAVSRERRVADWVVHERVQELAVVDELRGVVRRETRTRFGLVLHVDSALGRGTGRLVIDASEGTPGSIAARALSLATAAVGPRWRSVPPAAPAAVEVIDRDLVKANLEDAARALVGIAKPEGATVKSRGMVLREQIAVQAKNGFREEWPATELRADALVIAGERSLELTREARKLSDLTDAALPDSLPAAAATAVTDLRALAAAGAPPQPSAGDSLDLELATDALLHGDNLGVWAVFAVQADAALERQGLTRYRLGAPIVPGAAQLAEPLTITSDGAIDHALRSAPVGDEGDAIRRFDLVDRGVSAGLALTMQEAALRGRDPNGGIRNLRIWPGSWDGKPRRRTIEIRRLRALSIDRYTGDASLEIALAFDDGKPFSGGTVRLDLIAALSRARRRQAANPTRRGAYLGPPSVLIEGIELLA
jgi:predicted Zn-dependent protease